MTDRLRDTLKTCFGYHTFKPLQEEIIKSVLDGRDCVVIMPTGGGKSLCYQVPALILEGMALVVSPLIALMRDQVLALQANGIAAATINSSIDHDELKTTYLAMEKGEIKLLYVSPEKLLSARFLHYIRSKRISLIAIDEAHCVSIWGNDFRPEYAELHQVVSLFSDVPVIALTATADKATQKDIAIRLGLREPKRFLASFERKNIFLRVKPGTKRIAHILEFLKQKPREPGILYCLSRRSTEMMAARLQAYGYKARYYHAELPPEIRREVQDAFQRDEIQIVCATIAFGMGIDKANIRWVIHYNMPKNVESYYQEVGRSGRDGSPASALMFYNLRDVFIYRRFIEESDATETFKEVQKKKIDRILELARACNCRTNIILNYFGEYRSKPCGHCDNCLNPPVGFDGTDIARLIINACREANGKIGIYLLVDMLRGSNRREVRACKLHMLKSFGKGQHLSREQWIWYVTQTINLGLLEIDYTDHANLKCTPLSEVVMNGLEKVTLHRESEAMIEEHAPVKSKTASFEDDLFEHLRETRKTLANTYAVPAYLIFPDRTLRQIASKKPLTEDELHEIKGIGKFKIEQYGTEIIQAIRDFTVNQSHLPNLKGKSKLESLQMLKEGLTMEQIAEKRGYKVSTILSHLVDFYRKGENINLRKYLNGVDLDAIKDAWISAGKPDNALKPVYEKLDGSVDYPVLRIAIAIIQREDP